MVIILLRRFGHMPSLCRGQIIRVKAPWVKHYYNNNGQFYIIPNFETVVLGGTVQKNNWDTSINQQVCLTCIDYISALLDYKSWYRQFSSLACMLFARHSGFGTLRQYSLNAAV